MNLKNAVRRLFSRKAREEHREKRRASDQISEAQRECANVSIGHRQSMKALETAIGRNAQAQAEVRSKMPTRKIHKPDTDEEFTDRAFA